MDRELDLCPVCMHAKWAGDLCNSLRCSTERAAAERAASKNKSVAKTRPLDLNKKKKTKKITLAKYQPLTEKEKQELALKIFEEVKHLILDEEHAMAISIAIASGYSGQYVKYMGLRPGITNYLRRKYNII